MKHSVLVPVNKLNRGVTVNRCWQSDEMKDSHPILEETDSDPAAMRLFKVVHNQAITVTDLVLSVGERKKTTAECEMGATNIKVVHFSLHLFHASCLLSSPESRAPPGHCRAPGQRSLWTRMVAVLYSFARWGGGRGRELGLG